MSCVNKLYFLKIYSSYISTIHIYDKFKDANNPKRIPKAAFNGCQCNINKNQYVSYVFESCIVKEFQIVSSRL